VTELKLFLIHEFWKLATIGCAVAFEYIGALASALDGMALCRLAVPCVLLIRGIGECYRRWQDSSHGLSHEPPSAPRSTVARERLADAREYGLRGPTEPLRQSVPAW